MINKPPDLQDAQDLTPASALRRLNMATIRVKKPQPAAVRDYSKPETRDAITKDAKRQVRAEEVTLVRRLMRRKGC
jgi:hypothetical protein